MKYIINIGCYSDPNNYVLPYFSNPDYQIILVDAHPQILDTIKTKTSKIDNVKCYNKGISVINGTQDFYFDKEKISCVDGFCSHGSFSSQYWYGQGHKQENLSLISVNCQTFENFMKDCCDVNNIELLVVDCESLDCDIVDSINLNYFDIKTIVFEVSHSEGPNSTNGQKLAKTLARLDEFGYKYYKRSSLDGSNLVCSKEEKGLDLVK